MTIRIYDEHGNYDYPIFDVVDVMFDVTNNELFYTVIDLSSDKIIRKSLKLKWSGFRVLY